ncbi:class I SAM-dependent methyltransferase [Thermogemmatispora sp.]|uniref:class I SAM-dependent methyltransferase n=1 Tax=Thermogemmatispora sp. TaxID=1968838 RepID=UPI0035E3FB5F
MPTVKRWQTVIFSAAHPRERQPQLTKVRGDYVEAVAARLYGRQALGQEEILVVGCGQGQLCEELARRGAIVLGLDDSPAMLAQARRHAEEVALGHVIAYVQGRAEALPFASGSFSLVVSLQALTQAEDLRAAVAEMARVLAPGGLLVFEAQRGGWLLRLLWNWLGKRWSAVLAAERVADARHCLRPRELIFLLRAYGLQPGEIRGFSPRGSAKGALAQSLGRYLGLRYLGYALRQPPPRSRAHQESVPSRLPLRPESSQGAS